MATQNNRIIAIAKAVENTAKAIQIANSSLQTISKELIELQKEVNHPVLVVNNIGAALAEEISKGEE